MDSVTPVKIEPDLLVVKDEQSDPTKINPTGMRKLLPERIQQLLYPKKPNDEPLLSLKELILSIIRAENIHLQKESKRKNIDLRLIKQLDIQ